MFSLIKTIACIFYFFFCLITDITIKYEYCNICFFPNKFVIVFLLTIRNIFCN